MAIKLYGKALRNIGYPEGKVIGVAIQVMQHQRFKFHTEEQILDILKAVLAEPESYEQDEQLAKIAKIFTDEKKRVKEIELSEDREYTVYGAKYIEQGALQQMRTAMKLPVTVAGALMPDAHQGYGLPIGGVLATENAVIPYAVGVDIGCRMCLSIYPDSPTWGKRERAEFKRLLEQNTRFGFDQFEDNLREDAFLEDSRLQEIPFVKNLINKAYAQIGSSGGGNHFVEFGEVTLPEDNSLGVPAGTYLGLLSHSGSRGFGATIAGHYTQIAMNHCLLPKEAKHLAWLGLDTDAGREYWLAMNLAGDYASANHHHIHRRISRHLGVSELLMIENHHNFAWKELLPDGREVVVHRKGATPAGEGVLGIIPGSMASEAFIVRGKGNAESLSSASHGAGRMMSRTQAINSFSGKELRQHLESMQVDLIGGGVDESPFAYKDIHSVMLQQQELVDVVGTFMPRVVRMAKDTKKGDD